MHEAPARLHGQHDIFANGQIRDDAVALSVLGAESDAAHHGVVGLFDVHLLALDGDLALCGARGTENHLRGLRAAGAQQARKAHQLARPQRKGDVLHAAGNAQMRSGEHVGRVVLYLGALEIEDHVHVLADHPRDQLQLADLIDAVGADQPAVAQDGHAVGNGVYLIQEVRDEDDAHAGLLQLAHHVEEQLHLVFIQRGGRLVQNQDLCLNVHRAGDGNHLLNGG